MINEIQVREILLKELPEMTSGFNMLQAPENVYKIVNCFVDFTKVLINRGQIKAVKHCFKIAETLLEDGNTTVKNAIENVYVYSLDTVIDLSAFTTSQLRQVFNGSLKKEYYKQISTSGI